MIDHRDFKTTVLVLQAVILGLIVLLAIVTYQLNQANYGDLNHDGKVNSQDLAIMAKHYGKRD